MSIELKNKTDAILEDVLDLLQSTDNLSEQDKSILEDIFTLIESVDDTSDDTSEEDIDKMIENLSFEDYINHAYDDDELALVDSDSGEPIDTDKSKKDIDE